jgi:hypothetical protein
MAASTHAKADAAVKRLQAWLSGANIVPRRNGRLNKAALCAAVGITRSTLASNPKLRELIASLEKSQPLSPKPESASKRSELERELIALREENADLKRKLHAVTLLLTTGRSLYP